MGHDHNFENVDLGKVCLCFQIVEMHSVPIYSYSPHQPVLSRPILTSHQKLSIVIQHTSEMSGPAEGGNFVALFVKKLEKDQKPIVAEFFDLRDGWSVHVPVERVHYQCAVMLRVPPYQVRTLAHDVHVQIRLYVTSSLTGDGVNNATTSFHSSSLSSTACFKYQSNLVAYTYKATLLNHTHVFP